MTRCCSLQVLGLVEMTAGLPFSVVGEAGVRFGLLGLRLPLDCGGSGLALRLTPFFQAQGVADCASCSFLLRRPAIIAFVFIKFGEINI